MKCTFKVQIVTPMIQEEVKFDHLFLNQYTSHIQYTHALYTKHGQQYALLESKFNL